MTKFDYGELTYHLRGIGFRIHNALKGGHAEIVYEEALAWTLEKEGVPYLRQPRYAVEYQDKEVGEYYPDLVLAEGKVIVELKRCREQQM